VLHARTARTARPGLDRDFVAHRLMPLTKRLIHAGYFRYEVEGVEHVPARGRVVYAQNHAGWFALDAHFVTMAICDAYGIARAPYFATAEAALAAPVVGPLLRRSGAIPASWFRRPERLPDEVESCGIFPEGVRGNCKPFWEAYRMREWNRGFVRVALARGAPIVPVAVLGGEECLPVAWTVRALEPLIGSIVGLPVAPIPLPTRWRVVFHAPVRLDRGPEAAHDAVYCAQVAARVRETVQATLDRWAPGYPLGRLSSMVAAARPRDDVDDDPLAGPLGAAPAGARAASTP
jgi:1-acyl-sn-glycerol-3-phosphate acyltransferase